MTSHHKVAASVDPHGRRASSDDEPGLSITDRAAAILQEELDTGSLSTADIAFPSNIVVAEFLADRQDQTRQLEDALDRLDRVLVALQPQVSDARQPSRSQTIPPATFESNPPVHEVTLAVFGGTPSAIPGSTPAVTVRLACDDTRSGEVCLTCTDLVSACGRIPASHITVSPDSLRIRPGATADVTVHVSVPSTVCPGEYRGLLHAASLNAVWAIIRLTIE